ncbi:MAG: HIT family protein [Solirubrobacterales bacterium]
MSPDGSAQDSLDTGCAFCAIVAGTEPAEIVHRDDTTIAFLDRRPLFAGHVLLCPVEHHPTLPDLPPPLVEPLFATARTLADVVRDAMDAEGTFVAMNNVVSQSVPHLHVHVVPRRRKDGLRGFFWPRTPYPDDEAMAAAGQAIRDELARRS